MYDFPRRIKYLREINGLDRKQFAEKINASAATVSRYENDRMRPTLENAIVIAKKFGVTLDWLAGDGDIDSITKE